MESDYTMIGRFFPLLTEPLVDDLVLLHSLDRFGVDKKRAKDSGHSGWLGRT